MSELRDLTSALRAFSASLTSVEACLAEMVVNGIQTRESLHDLRNKLHDAGLHQEDRDRAMLEIQTFLGSFSHKQTEIHDMVTNLQQTVQSNQKALSDRVRAVEDRQEITQP